MARHFLSPIHKATRQLALYLEPRLAELGVSNAEGHLLSYLEAYGPCAIAELRRVLGHKKSTLSSMLDRLSARGLITRAVHPRDRRSFLTGLTDEGRAAARRIAEELVAMEAEIAGRLSERDLEGFRTVLRTIGQVTSVEVRAGSSEHEATVTRQPKETS